VICWKIGNKQKHDYFRGSFRVFEVQISPLTLTKITPPSFGRRHLTCLPLISPIRASQLLKYCHNHHTSYVPTPARPRHTTLNNHQVLIPRLRAPRTGWRRRSGRGRASPGLSAPRHGRPAPPHLPERSRSPATERSTPGRPFRHRRRSPPRALHTAPCRWRPSCRERSRRWAGPARSSTSRSRW